MSQSPNGHRFGDEKIIDWLQTEREWTYPRNVSYHPRSDKHGGAQSRYFVEDLVHVSDAIAEAAANGEIVYQEDYDVGDPRGLGWNTDLVIGPPAGAVQASFGDEAMSRGTPSEVWLAADAKSIMTEHQKARRNRQRDINSFADIMHNYHEESIAWGILLLNIADKFDSPLRDPDDITNHPNIERIIEEIIDLFDSINRSEGEISNNLDGAGLIVVDHTNLPDEFDQTNLATEPPAPQPGNRVHYRTFVREMADLFEQRFL